MLNERLVLSLPFDIERHKQTFVHYLEVVLLENGTVIYAVPSHQEAMIRLSCEKLSLTRDELNDLCPPEYYFDFMTWLCRISGCVAIWNAHMVGTLNDLQRKTLINLANAGLYHGTIEKEEVTTHV